MAPCGAQPVAHRLPYERYVEAENQYGARPRKEFQPSAICEVADARPIARELDQRNDGEGQLQAEDLLGEDNQLKRPALAPEIHGDCGRYVGRRPGNEAPQPWPHAKLEETLHNDLTRHGSR